MAVHDIRFFDNLQPQESDGRHLRRTNAAFSLRGMQVSVTLGLTAVNSDRDTTALSLDKGFQGRLGLCKAMGARCLDDVWNAGL